MNLSKEELALHDEMADKLPELIKEYLTRPDITSVSVSIKIIDGQLTDRLSFTFGVRKKLPQGQVEKPLPSNIDGFPTDVIEFEIPKYSLMPSFSELETSRTEKTDPLIGGVSISPDYELEVAGVKSKTRGTLGVMVNKSGDDRPYLITCAHVLAGTNTLLNSAVCQQSKWETALDYCHNCADLKAYFHENVTYVRESKSIEAWLDCAVARKGWFRNVTIGKVYGVDKPILGFVPSIRAELIGEEVCKSGIKTDVTKGTIQSITLNAKLENFDGTEEIARNLIQVIGKSGDFSQSGDSGSAVFLTSNSLMIGLLVAGNNTMSAVTPSDAIMSKWPELSF
ncbi:hypothetical protein [Rufibacter sp. LB8]|uniref:hypothetical protein n=1 Tax=Rufibacter sp. LB8 TaxID=2777781 RepID=UPI00178C759C|nr:hypothetical protein [Rufibacter sp. LB8]